MDINENLLQINTFTGGMNSDTSDAMLKNDQYRYAKNLRLITEEDENEGELHAMTGISMYAQLDADSILAITKCKDYIIVVYKKDNTWCIAVKNTTNDNPITNIFGPCSNLDIDDDVRLQTSYESDRNIKLYMCASVNGKPLPLMIINIVKELEKTNKEDHANYLYKYASTELAPPRINISSNVDGHISGGKVQYAYTLYDEGLGETALSPLSEMLSIYLGDGKGYGPGEESTKAVEVTITNIRSKKFSKVRVYRILYTHNSQDPLVFLVADEEPIGGGYSFDDVGDSIQEMSIEEFTSLLDVGIRPRVIEAKDGRLFAANILYTKDELDKVVNNNIKSIRNSVTVTLRPAEHYMVNASGKVTSGLYKPTFMPYDTYKYGIVFYKKGLASSAFYLKEVTINNYTYWQNPLHIQYLDLIEYRITPIYLQFTIDFPEEITSYFDSYEIVRCENTFETRRVLAHGIGGGTFLYNSLYRPAHYLTRMILKCHETQPGSESSDRLGMMTRLSIEYTDEQTTDSLVIFACPEYCYDGDNFKQLIDLYKDKILLAHDKDYCPYYKWIGEDDEVLFSTTGVDQSGLEGLIETDEKILRIGVIDTGGNLYYGAGLFPDTSEDHLHDHIGTYNMPGEIYKYTEGYPIDSDLPGYETRFLFLNTIVSPCYVLPDYEITGSNAYNMNIEELLFTKSPSVFDFADELENIKVEDNDIYYFKNGKKFINWLSDGLFVGGKLNKEGITSWKEQDDDEPWNSGSWKRYGNPIWPDVSSGGKYVLVDTDSGYNWQADRLNEVKTTPMIMYTRDENYPYPCPISTFFIMKKGDSYGHPDSSLEIYRSHGCYFNGIPSRDTIDLYDGDCYINMFNFNYSHHVEGPTIHPCSFPTEYCAPIISRIDLLARLGLLFVDNKSPFFQDDPVVMKFYTLSQSAYLYNLAYSKDSTVLAYVETLYSDIQTNDFNYRIVYSEKKENNEHVDSWTKFKSANFLDVDTRYKEITNLRLFNNSLMYWQEDAFGKLSVNERQLLLTSGDSSLVLGTGGVLDRYDYLTTNYGMKKGQYVDALSTSILYWWDAVRKKIMGYSDKSVPEVLQDVCQMTNYVNTHTPKDHPDIVYDIQNKDVIFNLFSKPIIYNERVKRFISEWDINYKYVVLQGDDLYFAKEDGIYKKSDKVILQPELKYVVNRNMMYNKTFDNVLFGGRMLGGDDLSNITFKFKTPLKQSSSITLTEDTFTNREYDFRFAIPRNNDDYYGGRMKGKTMLCELTTKGLNSSDFSLQYIITKYRMSWT